MYELVPTAKDVGFEKDKVTATISFPSFQISQKQGMKITYSSDVQDKKIQFWTNDVFKGQKHLLHPIGCLGIPAFQRGVQHP